MAIKITRNQEGNCITFVGSSNPAYWNSCLSAVLSDDTSRMHIINDIRSANEADVKYEFYNVDYTDFADREGNSFADAQAAVDYINANANVIGISDTGTDLSGITVDFRLDQTSTSIIMDNGHQFGVNTVKAIAHSDGTVHLNAIGTGLPNESGDANDKVHFEKLEVANVKVNGSSVSGGLNDIVNTLNELFTVGPFEAVVIADPYATMVADVSGIDAQYEYAGTTAVDPVGNDIFGNTGSGNYAGIKSIEPIDQAGEYYTFDIRGEGTIGFGLVHTTTSYNAGKASGNQGYADPQSFAVTNSAHYGFQFSHWFHPTPNGSWTNYGANTGYVGGPGWSNNWNQQDEWLNGDPVKIRVGLDENGYIAISSLQDDSTWILHARSSYPVADGSEFVLGIKSQSASARVYSSPKAHLLEAAAPTMYFRYIESPDNNFEYPLFATEEEANYYDSENGGSGTSHTHTYADDPTNTTWYMPDTNGEMAGSSAPTTDSTLGTAATYTEITSLSNSDLTPSQFSSLDFSYTEGTVVNFQLMPAGATWTQTVSVSPSGSGMAYNSGSGYLQGTLADVGSDTTYTVTVTRANAYGSSVGTFDVQATDVAPAQTNDTPWNKALDFSGSNEHAKMVSPSAAVGALRMSGLSQLATANSDSSKTSSNTYARPWATSIVFKSDGNSSNQHIWNSGEGASSGDDNLHLRVASNGQLFFGWGREGSGYNEKQIATVTSGQWYGVYIGFKGQRYNASGSTAANLDAAFDIRVARPSDISNNADASSYLVTGSGDWTSTGARMDRTVTGDLTIGGRGSNRNFHGQVASFVTTTLLRNAAMPTDAEIKMMVTDPMGWLTDYKVGNPFRHASGVTEWSSFAIDNDYAKLATHVWLMGDGSNDSYANGMRNQVSIADQNYGKLQLNSMVSNDIQNVTISGLT